MQHKVVRLILFIYSILLISCAKKKDLQDLDKNSNLIFSKIERASLSYWNFYEIDSAMLYVYYPDSIITKVKNEKDINIIASNGELSDYVLPEFTKVLNANQILLLQTILRQKVENLDQGSACFQPHHGIIMWNKSGDLLGHLTICLDCENYTAIPSTKYEIDMSELKKLIKSLNIPSNSKELTDYFTTGKWRN